MNKSKRITANEYWTVYLKEALRKSGWLPKNCLYLITYLKCLQMKITSEDIIEWYKADDQNLEEALDSVLYEYGVDEDYFSQTSNVRDLEDFMGEYYEITPINDEYCYIKEK